jgi:hypothetical protein
MGELTMAAFTLPPVIRRTMSKPSRLQASASTAFSIF